MGKDFLKKIIKIKFLKYFFIICLYFFNFTEIAYTKPKKETVLAMLEGRHWILKQKEFLNLGEGSDIILIDIAGDTTLINYLRFRAFEALSLYATEITANFLEDTAEKNISSFALRGFEAFKNGFYKIKPKKVKRLATRLLKHPNVNIRISAARTIKSIDTNIFKKFLKSEPNSWVRKEAQK